MATKDFAIRTENHVANFGDLGTLEFVPEILGDEFLQGYTQVMDAQKALGDNPDLTSMDPTVLREVYGNMRQFLASLMTPESAERFLRFEVIKGGKTVAHFRSRAEAEARAGELGGSSSVEDKSWRLPDRVLVELMEWTTELYGGGDRPTGPSSGSSRASRRAGTPSKGSSRSKGSTSTAGRSARS